MMDAEQALHSISESLAKWKGSIGENFMTYKVPNRKTPLTESFCRDLSFKRQIRGKVRVRTMKSISRFATPFQR